MTEMSKGFLEDRKSALEDAFFASQDRALKDKLRAQSQAAHHREALAKACPIDDPTVLDHLVTLGIHADTVAALALLPLVAVAWADGKLEARERDAIIKAVKGRGIEEGSEVHNLLNQWLAARPGADALDAWKEYMGAVTATMDAPTIRSMREQTVGEARAVANAAGGFLGIASISPEEQAVLDELELVFEQ